MFRNLILVLILLVLLWIAGGCFLFACGAGGCLLLDSVDSMEQVQ